MGFLGGFFGVFGWVFWVGFLLPTLASQEVVTMNIKDSLKFGVLIGLLEVSSRVTRNKEVVDAVLHLVRALFPSTEMEFLDMNSGIRDPVPF